MAANPAGTTAAAPMPWMARAARSQVIDSERATAQVPTVQMVIPKTWTVRGPIRSDRIAHGGMNTVAAAR